MVNVNSLYTGNPPSYSLEGGSFLLSDILSNENGRLQYIGCKRSNAATVYLLLSNAFTVGCLPAEC
jgi:hypothetical protein